MLITTGITILLEIVGLAVFIRATQHFETPHGEQLFARYATNFNAVCEKGELSAQNAVNHVLIQSGVIFAFYFSFLFTLLRRQILFGTSMPIQDYYTLNYKRCTCQVVSKVMLRVFFGLSPLLLCTWPVLFLDSLKASMHGLASGIAEQAVVVFVPCLFSAFYLFTLYDKTVYWIQDKFGYNDEFE